MANVRGDRRASHDEIAPFNRLKRPRTETKNHEEPISLSPEAYTVGWICALWIEMSAAQAMLDRIHAELPCKEDDSNAYILGNIASHNIVITCLPAGQYGTNNAAIVASNLRRTFPCLDKGLMVGIGGGVPDSTDVRLGDVVVGLQVVQYDFGKTLSNGHFQPCGIPVRPPQNLLTAVTKLRSRHDLSSSCIPTIMEDMIKNYPSMSEYALPASNDLLFSSSYGHIEAASSCDGCDQAKLLPRSKRQNNHPMIHYGTIASGNSVIKDSNARAKLGEKLNCLCLEMEAAGLMDQFPCLVIRGICDYCDSHKNKQWQKYSAAVAAAYAKELLLSIPKASKLRHSSPSPSFQARIPSKERRALLEALLDSLAFDQIEARLVTIKTAHSKTCEWFLGDPDYLSWLEPDEYPNHHGFLWIDGKPGAGKSTLIKFCYLHALANLNKTDESAIISFFFNARGSGLEQSIVGLYRSLLFQTLSRFPDLQGALDEGNHRSYIYNTSITWDTTTLQTLFTKAIVHLGQRRLTCFIDALDECNENEVREMVEFFDRLGSIASQSGAYNIRICFSSRHYPYIEIGSGIRLTLENQHGHSQDLRRYVQNKLRAGTGNAKQDITESILAKASGVFMWVVLVVDILNIEFQRGRMFAVQRRLNELPDKLSELFQEILTRDTNNMDDLLLCIQWILYSKRRLSCEEFYFGMVSGLEATPENLSEWDPERITREDMERFVMSSSKGLAELTKSKNQTVQFIHESVRDFLLKDNGIRQLWPEFESNFETVSHERLKQCCSAYMSVDISAIVPTGARPPPASSEHATNQRKEVSRRFPFLKYACKYIFYHANIAASTVPQISFLTSFPIQTWFGFYNTFQTFSIYRYTTDTTLVYILASSNCVELIKTAIHHGLYSSAGGGRYQYPLMAAVRLGHVDVVNLLLGLGEVDDKGAFISHRALKWATQHSDETMISTLLKDKHIDVDAKDPSSRTLLSYAAESRTPIPLKLFLATRRVNINSKDYKGFTPLVYAITNRKIKNVKAILEVEDVDVNVCDGEENTPFHHAIENNSTVIAKLLLATGRIDVNSRDRYGRTPLSSAAGNNHQRMVRFLLDIKEVDINSKCRKGLTPLTHAIVAKDKADNSIVKLLLGHQKVNINSRCAKGRTPLMYAVTSKDSGVVRLLLARKGIDIQAKDRYGSTALRLAKELSGGYYIKRLLKDAADGVLELDSEVEIAPEVESEDEDSDESEW
ncbi:unnamed protein product [Clonostachys rosea]|uniref:Nucleoside phosphorylase domain-containing protein n=1 Tax=Bionectria ochroleuca TaxID=29856 RepID=A0ABY6UXT7_BIOOC|nr:unnamed protein product [Clonostachys rosea]